MCQDHVSGPVLRLYKWLFVKIMWLVDPMAMTLQLTWKNINFFKKKFDFLAT